VGDLPELVRKDEDRDLTVKPPLLVNGRLMKENQTDRARFPVAAGQRWRFAVEAEALGSRLDAVDLSGRVSAARRRVETLERLHDESVRSLVDGRDENGRNERIDPLEHVDHDGHDGG